MLVEIHSTNAHCVEKRRRKTIWGITSKPIIWKGSPYPATSVKRLLGLEVHWQTINIAHIMLDFFRTRNALGQHRIKDHKVNHFWGSAFFLFLVLLHSSENGHKKICHKQLRQWVFKHRPPKIIQNCVWVQVTIAIANFDPTHNPGSDKRRWFNIACAVSIELFVCCLTL